MLQTADTNPEKKNIGYRIIEACSIVTFYASDFKALGIQEANQTIALLICNVIPQKATCLQNNLNY